MITKYKIIIGFFFLIGLLLRLSLLLNTEGPIVYTDEYGYIQNTRYLINGLDEGIDRTSYPIGYSIALVPSIYIAGDDAYLQYKYVILTNIILSLITILLIFSFLNKFTSNRNAGIISTLVYLYPPFVMYSGFALSENFFILLQICYLHVVWLFINSTNYIKYVFFLVLVSFICFIVRENGIFNFVTTFILLLGWKNRNKALFLFFTFSLLLLFSYSAVYSNYFGDIASRNSDVSVSKLFNNYLSLDFYLKFPAILFGQFFYINFSLFSFFCVPILSVLSNFREITLKFKKQTILFFNVFLLILINLVFNASFFTIYGNRGDHMVYGRYSEAYIIIFFLISIILYLSKTIKLDKSVGKYVLVSLLVTLVSLSLSTSSNWINLPINVMNVINIYPFITLFSSTKYVSFLTVVILLLFLLTYIFRKSYIFLYIGVNLYFLFISFFFFQVYYYHLNSVHKNRAALISSEISLDPRLCYDRASWQSWNYYNYNYFTPKITLERINMDDKISHCEMIISGKKSAIPGYTIRMYENNADQALFVKEVNNSLDLSKYTNSEVDLEFKIRDLKVRKDYINPSNNWFITGVIMNDTKDIWFNKGSLDNTYKAVRLVITWKKGDSIITSERCELNNIVFPGTSIQFDCNSYGHATADILSLSLVQEGVKYSENHTIKINRLGKLSQFYKNSLRKIISNLEVNDAAIYRLFNIRW